MKKLTTALLVLAAGVAAQASTVSYTDWDPTAGFTPVASGTTKLSYNSAFEVPKFNPGLGTLTKVSWYIYVDFTGTVDLTNNGNQTQSGTVDYGTKHMVIVPGLGINEISQPIAAGGPFAYSLDPNDSTTIGIAAGSDDDSGNTTVAGELANWTGLGNVNIPLTHESVLTLIGGGSLSSVFDQNGRSYIEVTYTYSDGVVPEPGTYVGGLALLGVGAMAYRRMRRA